MTVNLPKPFFAGAAGGGWRREVLFHCPARTLLTGIVLICRCPAGAPLTANLRAHAAAGGCFRACSSVLKWRHYDPRTSHEFRSFHPRASACSGPKPWPGLPASPWKICDRTVPVSVGPLALTPQAYTGTNLIVQLKHVRIIRSPRGIRSNATFSDRYRYP